MKFKELAELRYSSKNIEGFKQGIELDIMKYLHNFIKEKDIRNIVETGVCYGFSSMVFLDALGEEGKLISIEPNIKKEMLVKPKHFSNWLLINDTSNNKLAEVFESNKHDLFWHDSRHNYDTQMFEYELAKNYCKYVGSHDINASDAWKDFLKRTPHKLLIQKTKWGLIEIL